MTTPFRLGLTGFAVAVGLGMVVIAWFEATAWKQVADLRGKLDAVHVDSFHIADHLEAKVRELNDLLLTHDPHAAAAARAHCDREHAALRSRLDRIKPALGTEHERRLVAQFEEALAHYFNRAGALLQPTSEPAPALHSAARAEWVDRESAPLLDVSSRLRQAQHVSLDLFLSQSQHAVAVLDRLLALSSVLLMVMGVALAVLVYRGMIAPLQLQLTKSQAIIQRQEKLASLGVLAAGIAHEIRNPLTAIKARLFTQQELLRPGTPEQEDNQFISDEISRLDRIIKDFLLFARPSEPKLAFIRATAPLREIVGLLGPELARKRLELKTEFLADPQIQADSQQLKQVLLNLVNNAAEAIGSAGVITLRTRTVPGSRLRREGALVALEVEDTGKGIPPEVRPRLFDPFFTTKEAGTGLGLSIATRIVEKHGGRLEYETELSRGATFRVLLPIAHEAQAESR